MGTSIVGELVQILVAGITSLAQGIGAGLNDMVTSAFVSVDTSGTTPAYSLTAFGSVIASFGAIALAIGLTTLVTKWVMSLGGRN